jgi:phage repressor protein C with HTH and peptisase S24 domain
MKKLHNVGVILDRLKIIYQIPTDKELARFLDVKSGTISAWRSRNSINYDLVVNKCDNIDFNWLFNTSDKDDNPYNLSQITFNNNYVTIPKLRSTAIPEEVSGNDADKGNYPIIFSGFFIREYLKANPDDLYYCYYTGDSMNPTVCDHDLIIIDISKKDPVNGAIFVMEIDDIITCNRVQKIPGNRFLISSDNKAYSTYEINNIQDDFAIIGKVVWIGRNI